MVFELMLCKKIFEVLFKSGYFDGFYELFDFFCGWCCECMG